MNVPHDANIWREAQAAGALLRELRAQAASETEELSDDDAELVIESECSLKEAIQATLLANAEDEAHVAALKSLVATLEARARRKATRVERRRGAIMAAMEMVGLQKLELAAATLSVGKGICKVIIADPELIPERFKRQPAPVPDVKAIGAALKAGEEVDGAVLSNAMPTLRVLDR